MPRLLVVDDELAGLRRAHVIASNGDLYDILSDITDPRFEGLRQVALSVPAAAPLVADQNAAAAYFQTNEAVRDLFLSPQLQAVANQELLNLFGAFLGRHARVERLRNDFLNAFPNPEFTIEFVQSRPSLRALTQFQAVFLDLFLEDGSAGPVPEVKAYLKAISEEAADAALPPIILMSSHNELKDHQRNFSEESHISAAGLMILPKDKIADAQFGSDGLRLSFYLLSRQSSVAHAMRLFMASWMRALKGATEATSKILWNLDASAMQQFHLASVRDHDPYDEHLGELLSRDHLYRVESDSLVKARIADLDIVFRSHLSPDPREIANRMMSPLVDVASSRELMSHFTWLGSLPTEPLLSYLESECAARISRSLPFGSVLCGYTITQGERFLVHITQQCDLNTLSREKSLDGTLIFALAKAQELSSSDNPVSSELLLKNLQIQDGSVRREFDLEVVSGSIVAMPLVEFLGRARRQRLRVVGRLRSDVANQIVAATTNHLARPAAQLMLRPGMLPCKVFLRWTTSPGPGRSALKDASDKARVFSLTKEIKETFSFQDHACVDIALWLRGELAALNVQVNVDTLCTALRKGWRNDTHLLGPLRVRVLECDNLDYAFKALKGDIAANEIQLTVVSEK